MTVRPQKGLLTWIAAGVALSALAAYVTARLVTTRHQHLRSHTHAQEAGEADLHLWMHQHLDINETQLAALKPFEENYDRDHSRLVGELEDAGTDLAKAIANGKRQDPAIKAALDRINLAQAELQELTLDHFFVMKEHLSTDQAERLLEWTHDSITRQHRN